MTKKIVVGAIIQNRSGEFLLQQRTPDAPSFPLCWSLFGGVVEKDETPEQAILRELEEEIGLSKNDCESLKLIQTNIQPNGTEQIIFRLVTSTPLSALFLKEGAAMAFVPPADLFNREFAFNIKDVLRAYVSN